MLEADVYARLLDRGMPRGVSERQAQFLASLTIRPSLTRADYQALTGVSANTAQQDIAELVAAGYVLRVGGGPASRYCLLDKLPFIAPPARRHRPATPTAVGPPPPSQPHAVAPRSPADRPHLSVSGEWPSTCVPNPYQSTRRCGNG